jgi:hypothetical protein
VVLLPTSRGSHQLSKQPFRGWGGCCSPVAAPLPQLLPARHGYPGAALAFAPAVPPGCPGAGNLRTTVAAHQSPALVSSATQACRSAWGVACASGAGQCPRHRNRHRLAAAPPLQNGLPYRSHDVWAGRRRRHWSRCRRSAVLRSGRYRPAETAAAHRLRERRWMAHRLLRPPALSSSAVCSCWARAVASKWISSSTMQDETGGMGRNQGVVFQVSQNAVGTWHFTEEEEEEDEGRSENFGGKGGQARNHLICNQGKQLSHALVTLVTPGILRWLGKGASLPVATAENIAPCLHLHLSTLCFQPRNGCEHVL